MLRVMRETFFLWLANFAPRHRWFDYQRWRLLRLAGLDIGKGEVRPGLVLTSYGCLSRISIGSGVYINTGLKIGVGSPASVKIGNDCGFGPNVMLETMTHQPSGAVTGDWGDAAKSIIIGDRCWIATGAIILGGVTIGDGSVVAAGSVVTRDVPAGVVVGGNPARVARRIIPQLNEFPPDRTPAPIEFAAAAE